MARGERNFASRIFLWTTDLDLQILSEANKARSDSVAIDDIGNVAYVTQIHQRMAVLRQFDVDIKTYPDCSLTGRPVGEKK